MIIVFLRCFIMMVVSGNYLMIGGTSVPGDSSGGSGAGGSGGDGIKESPDIPQYILDMYNVVADENGIRRKEAPDLGRTVTCIFSGEIFYLLFDMFLSVVLNPFFLLQVSGFCPAIMKRTKKVFPYESNFSSHQKSFPRNILVKFDSLLFPRPGQNFHYVPFLEAR